MGENSTLDKLKHEDKIKKKKPNAKGCEENKQINKMKILAGLATSERVAEEASVNTGKHGHHTQT